MTQPCTFCGVRPDVACRHRPAMTRPADPFVEPTTPPQWNWWGGAVARGMNTESMFTVLAAQLRRAA